MSTLTPIARLLAIPVGAAGVWWFAQAPAPPAERALTGASPAIYAPAKPGTPYRSQIVDRDIVVTSARQLKTGTYLTDQAGQTVVCRPGLIPDPQAVVASTLHVRGTTAMSRGKERVIAAAVTTKEPHP